MRGFFVKENMERKCTRCKQTKDISNFGKHTKGKDGIRDWCKQCVREYSKSYREENSELCLERHRKYNSEHRDEINAKNSEYQKCHLEQSRAKYHRRRAKKLGNGGNFTEKDIELQLKNQGYVCWWCGKPFVDGDSDLKRSIDHRIPVDRGGDNNPGNIVLAHIVCNKMKSNKMPWEWSGRLL